MLCIKEKKKILIYNIIIMFISGDNISSFCDILIYKRDYYKKYVEKYNNFKNIIYVDEDNINFINKIKNKKNIFFTKKENIIFFISKILPFLKKEFILITHNSAKSNGNNKQLLNNKLLVKWYGQNMIKKSPKTFGIPLGLPNKVWKITNYDIIKENSGNNKENLLYINFSVNTNPIRKKVLEKIIKKGFTINKKTNWSKYIEEMSKYKFSLSPPGFGIDCHRTWECLYLNVIPIVLKNSAMEYFNDLPILFIDNFDVITKDYLIEKYDLFKKRKFNLEKLDINYWNKKMKKELNI